MTRHHDSRHAVSNQAVAADCARLADLLEIAGENPFRVRAWRNAAETIEGLGERLADAVAEGADLTAYPHIGKDIAAALESRVRDGVLPPLEEIAVRVPPELADLMAVKGLGPKGIKALYDAFRIRGLDDLAAAAEAGRVRELPGFGPKKEQALLAGIRQLRARGERRTRLDAAERLAEPLREWLAGGSGVGDVVIAGSYRRRKETVGDLDIVAVSSDGDSVMARLFAYDAIERTVSHGTTRSTVVLEGGLQVDLRAVPAESLGAALVYFTGSKAHNVVLRQRAIDRGWKLNEYGLFEGGRTLAGADEAGVYRALGLAWIPPELREDQGEVAAAETDALPALIEPGDLRGDLHAHTDWSDGKAGLEAMARAAAERGLEYLAITDHGPRVRVANGLDAERLRRQGEAIDALQPELSDITLLKGCEVDILEDGRLDLPDEVLAALDIVVCSIHFHLDLPRDRQTERVLRALDNPHCMIWGHPTAREIGRREPIDIDLERCLAAAAEKGVAVEINAQPKRLDLCDRHVRLALQKGCRLVINTDAHSVANLDLARFGVDQARRAWVTSEQVVNTLPLAALRRVLRPRP
ncbi:DNA polymerase/3'-5' exonuclease PolX [Sediminicurvatus halobius]|uniref:DNA-directed DNA polymerase n=1 Tax=Sediminicurvatus halobius TaxID=2182432 RepID=A0A2U2N575_9GAMM|nr:DNA polymerase/3'-5' exonuclease PolX [Spiribacter halobius]PWG64375.1 DNA polymerase III [Spiribacter halobius]UEX79277.1 DNA polymerase/3'-5' exonuclease PolX [Spiribacter halobius]